MSIASIALAFALLGQFQSDDGVILAISDDTAFVLPLSSLRHTGQATFATLVSIYPETGEDWEEVRRDTAVEINCSTAQWRVMGERQIARDGTVRSTEEGAEGWEQVPATYPPAAALKAIACDDLDVSSSTLTDWQSRLPEIRAALQ
ncbi:MAG: hypothetical protein V7678_01290 [Brevundimonas sp.]